MRDRVEAVGPHTSLADRKRRAGQRVIVGLEGHAVSDDLRALVKEIQPAGFILFGRNVAEPAQVRELNRELRSLLPAEIPPILSVDQEGGRVQRVRAPATVWPAMRQVGLAAAELGPERGAALIAAVATAMARELRAMGFNLDFAPDCDVDSNPANPVIGDRSFGTKPDVVGRAATTFLTAMQAEGIVACAKHFPGHGDTATDSHHELPIVEKDVPELRHVELPPFAAAVKAGVGSVMTAHVVYPAWDEERPATMSWRIQREILRKELGFGGVLFSDDMEMKAVRGRYPVEQQVREATAATVDVFLCCRAPELQIEVFDTIVRAQEEDKGFARLTEDSAARVAALRERFFKHALTTPDLATLGGPAHQEIADRVRATLGLV